MEGSSKLYYILKNFMLGVNDAVTTKLASAVDITDQILVNIAGPETGN